MDRSRWTISARRSGGSLCGEMGWKIRTRGRIRSPCRNEHGGNWGSIGPVRTCQDMSDRACELARGGFGSWILRWVRLPQYYIVRTVHTHNTELIIHRAAHHLSHTRKETRRARAGAWPLRRAAWAANNNSPGQPGDRRRDWIGGFVGELVPDIWCSFGRGMRWLWRSRRNDRQSLFLCIFLAEIGNRLTHSLKHSLHPRTRSVTHATLMLVLMAAGWWPIRRPSSTHHHHHPIHPTARYANIFFFLQRLGGPNRRNGYVLYM